MLWLREAAGLADSCMPHYSRIAGPILHNYYMAASLDRSCPLGDSAPWGSNHMHAPSHMLKACEAALNRCRRRHCVGHL